MTFHDSISLCAVTLLLSSFYIISNQLTQSVLIAEWAKHSVWARCLLGTQHVMSVKYLDAVHNPLPKYKAALLILITCMYMYTCMYIQSNPDNVLAG